MSDTPTGRHQRITDVFLAACARPARERSGFLDSACAGDLSLRAEVESLLVQHESDTNLLRTPAAGLVRTLGDAGRSVGDVAGSAGSSGIASGQLIPSVRWPDRIGRYRILGLLGEGGMGVVFLAEQEQPRRAVALKVIRPGFTSPAMLRRFEHEAQVLGRLQHPGIAQIIEAGTAEISSELSAVSLQPQVLPFFAMELVRGPTLLEHARLRGLSVREKLELLAKVCDAVQHAHQKGVIHRDLKPANILVVDEEATQRRNDEATKGKAVQSTHSVASSAQPKILDFGVARAIDADLQTTTLATDVGQVIGTVPYMSPELVAGDPHEVDTRSDVYALGVVGYEMLAGRLPHEVRRQPLPEALRRIREEEPTPLSSISPFFRGDLDTIVGKALQKDKTYRYQSASDLAADIRRYLQDEPIVARPASTMYQLRKFARRNRALVGGVLGIIAALILGVIGTSIGLVRAERQRRLAEANQFRATNEAANAQAVKGFLNEMLASADPYRSKGPEVTVREAIEEAARKIENGSLRDQPLIEAEVRTTLGNTYTALGLYAQAVPHLRTALDIRRRMLDADSMGVVHVLDELSLALERSGDPAAAEPLAREALDIRRRTQGDGHPQVAVGLARVGLRLHAKGDYAAAESAFKEALSRLRGNSGAADADVANVLLNLAEVCREKGDLADAEGWARQAAALWEKIHPHGHPHLADARQTLGLILQEKGDHPGAEALFRDVLAMKRRLLGDEHPDVARILDALALQHHQRQEYADAEAMLREAVAILRKQPGGNRLNLAVCLQHLSGVLRDSGDLDAAEAFILEAVNIRRKQQPLHPDVADALVILGRLLMARGDYAGAEPVLRECLDIRRKGIPEHWVVPNTESLLGSCLTSLGRYDEAEELVLHGYETLKAKVGDQHPKTLEALRRVCDLHDASNRPDRAAEYRDRLHALTGAE